MGRLVHTGLGSSSLVAHVLHYPPPPHANSIVIGTAVMNTHTITGQENTAMYSQKGGGGPVRGLRRGGRRGGVRRGPGAARTILLFIPLVLGSLNSL